MIRTVLENSRDYNHCPSSYLSTVFGQTSEGIEIYVTDIAPQVSMWNFRTVLFLKLFSLVISHGLDAGEHCAAKLAW